ncbi:ABC-type nitrate/sulfonate/bicarbonate transport system, substrate-binding protein [Pseudomonas flavescens]|uniref:ABC-type nitrate/sulfonate/bicarbonate transport system, substrate-binding protein n=1 Tax=Phytopseudomonas flavescens TaxID=29435 RepID=A0A1G8KDI9_9GAMM|nr:ABC transporter substrate-binding protein [Pseudomonas flavescens]SDI41485.1 ABC-type nitrate/sulfonate/bicarbonate transport system, substrate-binding protein [Pseudomonas flavescens]
MQHHDRRTFLKNFALLTAAGSVGLALPGCGPQDNPQPKSAGGAPGVIKQRADQVVEFKYPDNPTFDLVYVADSLGYFEGSRARPKYIGRIAAPQIIPLTGTGEIDFGARMVPLVISAIASGLDLKVVAAGGKTLQEAPHMKYFVRADSGIFTPRDIEGKTVGFNSFGACAEFVTKKFLREQGVDVDTIKWLVVPDNQAEQTLATGNVDVAIIHPPASGGAEHNSQLRKLWSDYDLDKGLGGMAPYSVFGKFSREHPEATRDVVSALAKAANWVNANPDDARKITSERIGMKLELVERFAYVDDLIVTEPPIQYYIDILESEGKLNRGAIQVKDVYTNQFNDFAKAVA